jgi:UDP-3-O-[3-hydroxymyristoyl] glucosamine N-acyltransferase
MKIIELAERIGAVCEPLGTADKHLEVDTVTSFGSAHARSVVFVEQARFMLAALVCDAGAAIVPIGLEISETEIAAHRADARDKVLLRSHNPRLAFALAAGALSRCRLCDGGVDASAIVDPTAEVHPTACVDELSVVGAAAKIGPRTHIGPGCMIGPGVVIGEDCDLIARVSIYPGTTLADRVIVQAGAVLGSDGFGFVPDPATGRYHKFPQIGRLEIGSDVEIGANTTIDRGALDATVISDGVKLDNLVQVGHNVHIGRNVVVASQTGISGSTIIEDGVIIGGQVGIADHVRVESGVILGSQCGIPSKKVIRGKNVLFWGTPARPIAEYLKELATLSRLTKKK